MPAPLNISTISLDTFNATLARYPSIAPAKLKDLDILRYVTVPAKLAKQKKEGGETWLEKAELESLVEWKLKHGTFRPRLLSLVQANSNLTIKNLTTSAYATLDPDALPSVLQSLKCVTGLGGVGPATASLVLAVYDPDSVPFFSDELLRWTSWGNEGKGEEGWKKKIKYNVNEYVVLFEGVGKLRERLGCRAVDVERVAWVLGKEGADVGSGGEEGVGKGEDREPVKMEEERRVVKEEEGEKNEGKKGMKRKTEEPISPPEGVRRSTRRKAEGTGK